MTPQTSSTLASWGATPPIWLAPSALRSIERICRSAAAHCGVTPESLFSPYRENNQIATARQLAMAAIRARLQLSLETTGQIFSGRDHGTVIHACKATANRPQLRNIYQTLTSP